MDLVSRLIAILRATGAAKLPMTDFQDAIGGCCRCRSDCSHRGSTDAISGVATKMETVLIVQDGSALLQASCNSLKARVSALEARTRVVRQLLSVGMEYSSG